MTMRTITISDMGIPITADVDDHGWNGYHVPLLTLAEFNDYLARCEQVDRNGEWHQRAYEEMTPGPFATRQLRLPHWEDPTDRDHDDVWDQAEDVMTADGYRSGYRIDGWTWVDYVEEDWS